MNMYLYSFMFLNKKIKILYAVLFCPLIPSYYLAPSKICPKCYAFHFKNTGNKKFALFQICPLATDKVRE